MENSLCHGTEVRTSLDGRCQLAHCHKFSAPLQDAHQDCSDERHDRGQGDLPDEQILNGARRMGGLWVAVERRAPNGGVSELVDQASGNEEWGKEKHQGDHHDAEEQDDLLARVHTTRLDAWKKTPMNDPVD